MIVLKNPRPQFTRLIANNLTFWQDKIAQLSAQQQGQLLNDRSAIHRAVTMGLQVAETVEPSIALMRHLSPFIERYGYWHEWLPILEQAQQVATSPNQQQFIALEIAFFRGMNREWQTAVALLQEFLNQNEAHNDEILRGQTHFHLGNNLFALQKYDEARRHTEQALTLFTAYPPASRGGAAPAHNLLGLIALRTAGYATAITHFQTACRQWQQSQHDDLALGALLNEAQAHQHNQDQVTALSCYQQARPLVDATDGLLEKGRFYLNLGTLYSQQEQWIYAERAYLEANRDGLRRQGHIDLYARLVTSLGHVLMEQGQWTTAVAHLKEAIAHWRQLGDELMEANALDSLGDAYHCAGDYEQARATYEQGWQLSQRHPNNLYGQQLAETLQQKIVSLPLNS